MSAGSPPVGTAQRRWLLVASGIVLLLTVVVVAIHLGDLEHFAALAERARPSLLLVALALQLTTYFAAAAVWHLALADAGVAHRYAALVPLAVAKLFTDQVAPSGGLSGFLLLLRALVRRRVPAAVSTRVITLAVVSYYVAYAIAIAAAVAVLATHHLFNAAIVTAIGAFVVLAGLVVLVLLVGRRWLRPLLTSRLLANPDARRLVESLVAAPPDWLRRRGLFPAALGLQLAVMLLDALTLWILLAAVGEAIQPVPAAAAFLLASLAATLGPVPIGIGTFEAACIASLGAFGVPIEPALAATLLLRGLSTWLPMLPGLWITRRELRAAGSPAV